jgi:hypothetical protein
VIFAIMATVTVVAAGYLLVSLRGHLSRTALEVAIPAGSSPDAAPPATVSAAPIGVPDLPTSGMA